MKDQIAETTSLVYWLEDKLYLNLTNRCTNNCYFCIRKFKQGILKFNLTLEREPQLKEVIAKLKEVVHKGSWSEYVFCGFGEPTIRLNTLLRTAEWLNKNQIGPIRVNTNGLALLLYPNRKVIDEIKEAGIDRLSVSLNTQNADVYNSVCRPIYENAYERILEFIEKARDSDLDVEITTVAIPEVKVSEVEKIAGTLGVGFRVRPYSPCIR